MLLKKATVCKKSREHFWKFTVARRGKEISENFKFHFCHRITKQIKNRTLHDIMHDLSNNTARTSSRLKTEGLSEGLHVPLMSQACPKGGTFYKINTSSSSNQEKKIYQE